MYIILIPGIYHTNIMCETEGYDKCQLFVNLIDLAILIACLGNIMTLVIVIYF
jgi:hypothetical protein